MIQNFRFNPKNQYVVQERAPVVRPASCYRQELDQIAFKRLSNTEHAYQLVDKAINQLGAKENLDKITHFLRTWIPVYVNYLCDLQEQNNGIRNLNWSTSFGCEDTSSRGLACPGETSQIVHQMQNNLTRCISPPSPAA